jgi:hypothetical protein
MLLAPDRQVRRSTVSSIIGTPMPPAAAPYRASGLVLWHRTDMPTLLSDVRCWGQSGKHLLLASISPFDPLRTLALIRQSRRHERVATDVGDGHDGQFSRLGHPGFDFHQTADC